MMKLVILCLVAQYVAAAQYDCANEDLIPITDEDCPLQLQPKRGSPICYAMLPRDSAAKYTYAGGELECAKKFAGGRLADVVDEETFRKVRCYMIQATSLQRSLNPKVLLGMKYNPNTEKWNLENGQRVQKPYIGELNGMLEIGTNVVFRVSTRLDYTMIFNHGKADTNYDRILCQFSRK